MDIKKLCIHCMHEKPTADGACPHCGKTNSQYERNPNHLPPMTPLNGKYLLGRALGQGGFGITYIALDTHLQVIVAIKELYLRNINSRQADHTVSISNSNRMVFEENRKRFLNEARVLAMFGEKDKEGIVSVRDHFEENGTAYIVMEYLDGITLKEHIKANGPMSFDEAQRVMESVGHALMKVHEFNMIHKDVGPDNIMVLSNGGVKLLDFGAATAVHRDSGDIISFKRGYAPPEQYMENGRIGAWTDIYALAATTYFCITGVKPVDAMQRNAGQKLEPPSKHGAKINAKIETALMKAMELRPNERYHKMEDFLNAIRGGGRKPGKPLLPLLAVGAVAVALVVFLSSNPAEPVTTDPEQPPESTVQTEPQVQYQVGDTIPMTLGTYVVESYTNPGLILGIDSGFCDDGARLVLKEYSLANRNRVMITDVVEDGFYNLQIGHTSSFLQTNNTQELGATVIQNSQMMDSGTEKWVFVYCGTENGRDVVMIKNAANSVMAPEQGIVEAGRSIVIAEQNANDDSQKWYLTWNELDPNEEPVHVYHEGDMVEHESGVHTVASAFDGVTMWAVSSNAELAEPEMIVWENVWDSTQHFNFEFVGESRYRITPVSQPGKCLEFDEATGRVYLRDVSDNVNQLFRVVYTGYNMYLIQAYNDNILGYDYVDGDVINGKAIVVKPYADFADSRQVKWLLGDINE